MTHVGDTVASTIRPDRHLATAANLQPLWLLIGSLVSLVICIYLSSWLFPPEIGIGTPVIAYQADRFVVTSEIVNHKVQPAHLRLRFKMVPASAGTRGYIRPRPFAVKDISITIPGTAETTARCEFLRTAFLPVAPNAEIELLGR